MAAGLDEAPGTEDRNGAPGHANSSSGLKLDVERFGP
jgi:hypothetical protein